MTQDATPERRLRMPDGTWWTAWFRHEMAQLMRAGRERERKLYVFFTGEGGALRRAEVSDEFKASATDDELRDAWRRAESLTSGGSTGSSAY